MSTYTIKQSKIIALILILLMGLFLVYTLKSLVSAILGSIVIYVLFRPFFIYLTEKLKLNRPLGATIIILVSFIIIVIPFISLSLMLVNKVIYYLDNPDKIKEIISNIENFAGQQLNQPGMIEDAFQRVGTWVVGIFPAFMDTALAILLTVSMMYFFLYFMLTKHEVFENTLIRYLPFRSKNVEHFANELKNTTFSNIIGQGLIAFIQGGLLAIGFWIFSIPDPVFWGLIAFFLSFLPVIGSPIVFIPAGIIELSGGNTFGGIGILIWGFVLVINIDNVLRLWINKRMGNIHPLVTITGVVIGIPIFGILGIVFGPLLISTFILLIRLYEAAYADNPDSEKERVISRDELKSSNE
jgi:predicted PurR-regulated permease PerM